MRKPSFGHRLPRGKPHRGRAASSAPGGQREGARGKDEGGRGERSGLGKGLRVRKGAGPFAGKGGGKGAAQGGETAPSRKGAPFGARRRGSGPHRPEAASGDTRGKRWYAPKRDGASSTEPRERGGSPRGKADIRGKRAAFKPGRDEDTTRGSAEAPRRRERHEGGARSERHDGAPAKAGAFKVRKPARGASRKPLPQQRIASVSEPMRIAKAMARAGLCSRREAERWIAEGRVSLNGAVLKTPAVEVKPRDRVLVDGIPLPVAEPAQLWRYNKPKGLVTTHNDPQGRPTVFDNLPPGLPRVISVGRLDFNTEGLILLTNDGELARHLELPATGWLRRYRVRCKGRVTEADLARLKEGVEIEGVRYGSVEAAIDTMQGANMWLTIGIREGKNREVRKVLSSLGLDVNRLIRISFGPFQLLDLEPGQAEIVRRRVLADQLGPQLATEFGLVEKPEDGNAAGRRPARKPKPDGGSA